jgi:hypothetical protein
VVELMKGTPGQIADLMRRRAAAVVPALEFAAGRVAVLAKAESKRIMQADIYNVAIPKTAKGTPKWRRSGQLKRREEGFARGVVVILRNTTPYALSRYTLGTPDERAIQSPGVKSVQWQGEAVIRVRPRVLEERRRAVLRALSAGAGGPANRGPGGTGG